MWSPWLKSAIRSGVATAESPNVAKRKVSLPTPPVSVSEPMPPDALSS